MLQVLLYIVGSITIMLFFDVSSNFISTGVYYDLNLFKDTINEEYGTYDKLISKIIMSVSYIASFVILLWFVCLGWLIKILYLTEMEPEDKSFMYLMLFFGFVVVPLTTLIAPILKSVV